MMAAAAAALDYDYTKVSYTTLTDIRTLVHWFKMWSRHQRADFLAELTKAALPLKVTQ